MPRRCGTSAPCSGTAWSTLCSASPCCNTFAVFQNYIARIYRSLINEKSCMIKTIILCVQEIYFEGRSSLFLFFPYLARRPQNQINIMLFRCYQFFLVYHIHYFKKGTWRVSTQSWEASPASPCACPGSFAPPVVNIWISTS